MVPIPGVFHMGLNAQEAIFAWYQPVTSRLTSAVFGKALLSVPLKALHRKYFLDLLINGWRLCRRDILRRMEEIQEGNIDAILLLNLFEEVVPVALDLYAAFLDGDSSLFESLLLRSLRIYAQLGKENYVNCLLLFIGTTEYWRTHFPEVHEKLLLASIASAKRK
jgi:hypothetical protein